MKRVESALVKSPRDCENCSAFANTKRQGENDHSIENPPEKKPRKDTTKAPTKKKATIKKRTSKAATKYNYKEVSEVRAYFLSYSLLHVRVSLCCVYNDIVCMYMYTVLVCLCSQEINL